MVKIDLTDMLTDIDDRYIEEAENFRIDNVKNNRRRFSFFKVSGMIAAVALCVFMIIIGLKRNGGLEPLSASAQELGMEEYMIGASLPVVIYGDDEIVIMYDFRGIYVYDLSGEKLIGFADFRPIDMTVIQGDNPTFVEVTSDGKYVKFYNNESRFLYLVQTNTVKNVDNYDDLRDSFTYSNVSTVMYDDEHSLSTDYVTYELKDCYVSIVLEFEPGEEETIRYNNLHLIRESDDEIKKYVIFQ